MLCLIINNEASALGQGIQASSSVSGHKPEHLPGHHQSKKDSSTVIWATNPAPMHLWPGHALENVLDRPGLPSAWAFNIDSDKSSLKRHLASSLASGDDRGQFQIDKMVWNDWESVVFSTDCIDSDKGFKYWNSFHKLKLCFCYYILKHSFWSLTV